MDLPGEPTRPDDSPAPGPEQSLTGEVMDSGGPQEEKASTRGKRIGLIVAAAVAVAGIGGGAYAAASALGGGGTQPEDVLPAGALAFAKVDLDPAAGQKVAVYRLSRKFPDLAKLGGSEDTALKDTLIKSMFEGDEEISYETDVKPWLGDRAGVAFYPSPSGGNEPEFAVAVEYTDEKRMNAALSKDNDGDFAWVTKDGFAIISEKEEQAQRLSAKAEDSPLAGQQNFVRDIDALDGDQIAVAWADIGQLYESFGDAADSISGLTGQDITSITSEAKPSGRVAVGLHAASSYLEIQGSTYDTKATADGTIQTQPGATAGTGLVQGMPADALAALSITGLGDALTEVWDTYAEQLGDADVQAAAQQFGVKLPADIKAFFGDETAVALSGDLTGEEVPRVTASSRGGDAQRVTSVFNKAVKDVLGTGAAVEGEDGAVVFGNDVETVQQVAAGSGGLGASEAFREAAPDADKAGLLLYADIGKLVEPYLQEADAPEGIESVHAFGLTTTGKDDITLRLRLTFR